jgi:hypothetical protein
VIYLQSVMETGSGIEAILRPFLNILTNCNVGIRDGRDL